MKGPGAQTAGPGYPAIMEISWSTFRAKRTPNLLLWILILVTQLHGMPSVMDNQIRVTTKELEPYVMRRIPAENELSGPMFEGYVIDLMERLADILNFKVSFQLVRDGEFGHLYGNGSWNGMVGELVRQEADVAAAPMFITEYRARAVDFTFPFMEVHATLLLQKPPDGQQLRISSLLDLVSQTEVTYGTLNTGILRIAMRKSNDSAIKTLWRNMQKFQPPAFTQTNQEGINRVRTQRYAYVIPSTIGDYMANQRPCDLVAVDRFLPLQGYGLAVPKGTKLLNQLNGGLLVLDADGTLKKLYHKWWVEKSECNAVQASKIYSTSRAPPCLGLRLSKSLVLLASLVLSLITGLS